MDRVTVLLASRPWLARILVFLAGLIVAACDGGGGGTTRDY